VQETGLLNRCVRSSVDGQGLRRVSSSTALSRADRRGFEQHLQSTEAVAAAARLVRRRPPVQSDERPERRPRQSSGTAKTLASGRLLTQDRLARFGATTLAAVQHPTARTRKIAAAMFASSAAVGETDSCPELSADTIAQQGPESTRRESHDDSAMRAESTWS
jgi:hypothetical protein